MKTILLSTGTRPSVRLSGIFRLLLLSLAVFSAAAQGAMTDREEMELIATGKLRASKASTAGGYQKPVPSDTVFLNGWSPTIGQYLGYGSEILIPIDIKRYFGIKDSLIECGALPERVDLTLDVWDVDEDTISGAPEVDNVYFNGSYIGTLTGHDDKWRQNTFKIPIELVNLPKNEGDKGENIIRIEIDVVTKRKWCVKIDWAALEIPAAPPVIISHGIKDSANGMKDLEKEIAKLGLPVHTFDYSIWGFNSIISGSKELKKEIDRMRKTWGVEKVTIVAHSMGGLKARDYVTRYDRKGETVDRVIQIATPNGGTSKAGFLQLSPVLSNLVNLAPALHDLTPWSMSSYNKSNKLNPNVSYMVLAGNSGYMLSELGPGDGWVSVKSAHTVVPAHPDSPVTSPLATHGGLVVERNGMVENTVHQILKSALVEDTSKTCKGKIKTKNVVVLQSTRSIDSAEWGVGPMISATGIQRQASELTEIPFSVRKGNTTAVVLIVEQNDISSLSFVSPSGISLSEASPSCSIEQDEYCTMCFLNDPEPGSWVLRFRSSGTTPRTWALLVQETDSGIELNAELASESIRVGNTFSVSMRPKVDGTVQTGVSCSVVVRKPDDTTATYALRHIGGGVYTTTVPAAAEGRYSMVAQTTISGTTYSCSLDGTAHTSSATIGADAGSGPVDEDGDGLYDWLVAKVGITGANALKEYRVLAELVDADGNHIEWASGTAEAGESVAELYFNGAHIFDHGRTSKYVITDVRLFETGDDWEAQIDAQSNWLELDGKTWSKFDHALVSIPGTGTDSVVWTGNGAGYLSVGLDIVFDVSVAGAYNFSASLKSADGTLISSAYGTATLSSSISEGVGTERISMTFSGDDILAAGEAGPWIVTDVLIWNNRNELSPEGEYETQSRKLSDFGGSDGNEWFVDAASGDDANTGRAWSRAKKSIQAAIDEAEDGDVIHVNDGVYEPIETVRYEYQDGTYVSVGKRLEIVSENGAAATIIDGSLTWSRGETNRCAFLGTQDRQTGEPSGAQAVLDGFTLRKGRAVSSLGAGAFGGTLRNCTITENLSDAAGSGAYCATLEHCTVSGNRSDWHAGGTYACDLFDCIVENNSAAGNGGGTAFGRMVRCVVRGNSSEGGGGGTWSVDAEDCLIVGNESVAVGGGATGANLSRCTVVGNRTAGIGGGTYMSQLHSCIVWDNAADGSGENHDACDGFFTDTAPALPGAGNVCADPRFRDAAAGDYRLSTLSPCIDAGFGPTDTNLVDLAGSRRWQGVRTDMGAYEFANSLTPRFSVSTIWVDAVNGDDARSGVAPEQALASIGAAVQKAADGSTIRVLPGTYAPFTLDGRTLHVVSEEGAERTVVDGGGLSRCVWAGTDSSSEISGFTLQNGNTSTHGGGIWGGIVSDCIIRGNVAGDTGGGAYAAVSLSRSRIEGNEAIVGGGCAYAESMTDCLVAGNEALHDGGGVQNYGGVVLNCTIVGNRSLSGKAGGVASAVVLNSIVWGNDASVSPDIWGCDEWHVCSSVVQPDCGSISADPLFADAANGDYRLGSDSPCIDAGGNARNAGETDLDGKSRILFRAVDVGAFEFGDEIETLPVHRFYSKAYKGHFFTIDEEEKQTLIDTNPNWRYEGVAYRAYTNEAPGTTALYRFYSKGYRGHFFTIDEEEMQTIRDTNPNWKYEGVAYYVYPEEVAGTVPVFRFWSKGYRHHFYTTDETEKDNLIATNPNWKYEGVAFWALPDEAADGGAGKGARCARPDAQGGETAAAQGAGRKAKNEDGAEDPRGSGSAVRTPASRFSGRSGGDSPAGETTESRSAAWTLEKKAQARNAADGVAIAVPGVTDVGGAAVETRADAPDEEEFAARPAGVSPAGELALRLALPGGAFDAELWSAADGTVADETAEGAFEFPLPTSGVWHWLRVRDADGEKPFSVWLRAE